MNQIMHKAVQLGLEEQLEYRMGGEVSIEGDVYSYGILLLEMFTGKRSTDSMFTDNLSLDNYAKMALPERVMDIVDPQIILEDKDESNMSRQSSKCNTARTNECLVLILRIRVLCSAEMPRERMGLFIALLHSSFSISRLPLSSAKIQANFCLPQIAG
ncbi:hypothetical protein F0562_011820 [Nyssa sinensis]|uniref:Serine-threonine/tyrosine-protein kinase catalytic domain-containing protein n=1 Tax=Nyssa sinensis TaxID=561372 RepID=A0A5J4ZVJ7_9ASTE|nr:hypothetical protein F0562_011820 [Nyssa sinensis]